MARVAISVRRTDHDRRELERLINSRLDGIHLIERARIVMGCLAGKRNDEIAAELDIRPGTVGVSGLRRKA
jgi:DNA-binding CsgD family transcriptional regulator